MSPVDSVWEELGKIDYLLDQFARAVERGEVGLEAYERLTPRYLERRAELAAILSRRADREGTTVAVATPVTTPDPGSAPAPIQPADRTEAPPMEPRFEETPPVAYRSTGSAVAPETRPPAPPERTYYAPPVYVTPRPVVSAGAWMTYAGAFLVVVAVAIFTIYAWGSMPVSAKLAVLLAVTAGFYAGGEMVRTKMDLPAVGVALIGVGSAMLLFDGWAVINGFGLSGLWPWAFLLLGCSLVYWLTELRIAGGWFGAVGAAAQVGWWWLLGQALHLPVEWQIAGIALVGLAWAVAGGRVGEGGPLAALGTVLRVGSLVLAAVTSVGILQQAVFAFGSGTAAIVVAAFTTAVAATVVVELRAPQQRGFSAALHIPVLLAVMAYGGSSGSAAAMFAALAIGYGAYAVVRGGAGYAVVALAGALLSVPAASDWFGWSGIVTASVADTLVAAAAVGGFILSRWANGSGASASFGRTASEAGGVWHPLGLAGLALMTFVGTSAAAGGVPLAAFQVTGSHALLSVWVLVLWVLLVAVTRRRLAGWVTVAWSFYALAAGMAWALPHLHSAWYATALLALAVAWRHAEPLSSRALGIDAQQLLVACRVLFVVLPMAGLGASAVFFSMDSYPAAVLFAAAAIAWAADALREKAWPALAPAAAFGVSAAFLAGWTATDLAGAAVVAAAAGAALALVGAFGPRRLDGWGAFLAGGAVVTGTLLALPSVSTSDRLTAALLLCAAGWALTAVAADLPALFGAAGLLVSFALYAALTWLDPSPMAALVAYPLLAGLLFVPCGLGLGRTATRLGRASRPLALAGLATSAQLALMGLLRTVFGAASLGTHALEVGEFGLGLGLVVTGAIAVLWSGVEEFEAGGYLGYGIGLAGVFAFMDLAGVSQAEFYLIGIAAYAIAMGVLYTRWGVDRRMPSTSDGVAFIAAVVGPFLLSLNPLDFASALQHGLWALGLAVLAIVAGLMTRTRIYFLGGIAVASLEALWLSRSVLLALPTWVWIGLAGLALIGGGVTFARHEVLDAASRRVSEGLTDWR